MDTHIRREYLREYHNFLESSRNEILNVISTLEWDVENVLQEEEAMEMCPVNSEHRVPKRCLEDHVSRCTWKAEGYHQDDPPLPASYSDEQSHSSIQIGEEEQNNIIMEARRNSSQLKPGYGDGLVRKCTPRTADRMFSEFSADERLALYDYVVNNTEPAAPLPAYGIEDLGNLPGQKDHEGKQPKTHMEILAELRDAKRRRISYKKVHTNRKSHVEIIREVIQNQMELLKEWSSQEEVAEGHNRKDSVTASNRDGDEEIPTRSVFSDEHGRKDKHKSFEGETQRGRESKQRRQFSDRYKARNMHRAYRSRRESDEYSTVNEGDQNGRDYHRHRHHKHREKKHRSEASSEDDSKSRYSSKNRHSDSRKSKHRHKHKKHRKHKHHRHTKDSSTRSESVSSRASQLSSSDGSDDKS